MVGDFEQHLPLLRDTGSGRRMIAFLGSTIGNLEPGPRAAFLRDVRAALRPGDTFLLGVDLVKDAGRLVARLRRRRRGHRRVQPQRARASSTASWTPTSTSTRSSTSRCWDAEHEWIEMRLRSTRDSGSPSRALDLAVQFAAGEEMRTEISAKFRRAGVDRAARRRVSS